MTESEPKKRSPKGKRPRRLTSNRDVALVLVGAFLGALLSPVVMWAWNKWVSEPHRRVAVLNAYDVEIGRTQGSLKDFASLDITKNPVLAQALRASRGFTPDMEWVDGRLPSPSLDARDEGENVLSHATAERIRRYAAMTDAQRRNNRAWIPVLAESASHMEWESMGKWFLRASFESLHYTFNLGESLRRELTGDTHTDSLPTYLPLATPGSESATGVHQSPGHPAAAR